MLSKTPPKTPPKTSSKTRGLTCDHRPKRGSSVEAFSCPVSRISEPGSGVEAKLKVQGKDQAQLAQLAQLCFE